MRALTMYPEHAECFLRGVRNIETRAHPSPWSSAVGQRIGIHAGSRDPDSAVARRDPISRAAMDGILHGDPLTKCAVVAVATLHSVVPIVDRSALPHTATPCVTVNTGIGCARPVVHYWPSEGLQNNISRQAQFGDFTPGRFALIFTDLVRLQVPSPARGRLGLWEWDEMS